MQKPTESNAPSEATNLREELEEILVRVFSLSGQLLDVEDSEAIKNAVDVIENLFTTERTTVLEARIDELTNFEPFFGGDHKNCPDPTTCIGYQNAQSDFDNEKAIRLTHLQGEKK